MNNHRFISNTLPNSENTNRNLQFEYENVPIQTLDGTVESISTLVPGVTEYVSMAKQACRRDLTLFTWDQSAAIYLYTMSIPFFSRLNAALRDPNRQVLHPWLPFLKLLMSALEKLPQTKAIVWRGVHYDARLHFVDNDIYTWWGVTSCSKNINRVQAYLGESGTLFTIEAVHGKDISMFSAVPDEQEVVLMPGTHVRAKFQPLSFIDRLFVIHLEEIDAQK